MQSAEDWVDNSNEILCSTWADRAYIVDLIRAAQVDARKAALEEAALVADEQSGWAHTSSYVGNERRNDCARRVAVAIRALTTKEPMP